MSPLVSICIPTYNGDRFLAEALISVEAQTYEHCEVVVSDDASSDRTLEIVQEFAARSKYEYRIFNHEPSGIGANWNHCVEQAEGEYIKFLFQDDLLKPECIAEMVRLMETDPEIGLVFCKRRLLISSKPTVASVTWCYMHLEPTRYWGKQLSMPIWGPGLLKGRGLLDLPRNKVGEPPSVLLRRSVFESVGLFNTELKQSLDYEYWYRVFAQHKVGFVPRELNVFRVHENQTTQRNERDQISEKIFQNLRKQIGPTLLHKEVSIRASGHRSLYSVLSAGIYYGKSWLISLFLLLRILNGRRFLITK